jgi:plasmid stability protein
MAYLELRDLDDSLADALRARADRKGISLEEEVLRTLAASVEAQREEHVRRLRAFYAAAGGREKPERRSALREEGEAFEP